MRAQGWYRDPYLRHGERWISEGRPTSLVRDDGIESYEAPPPGEPAIPAGGWLAIPEPRQPWPLPEASWQAKRRQRVQALAIVAAVVVQLGIWVLVYAAMFALVYTQAWPPGGLGGG